MMPATQHSRAAYDNIADVYDSLFIDRNPYYDAVTLCERKAFEAWIPSATKNATALDIGCGTGLHTCWFAEEGYETLGIDPSPRMIRIAATKTQRFVPRPRLLVADAFEGTLLGSEQFSAVCCLGSTLNHISDWHRLAQSVSDRLQSGGVFVFSFDNLFGIDVVARVVLREYSGYSRQFWQDVIIERAKAVWHGRPFHNHWQVGGPGYNLEVGLTYERMSSWERYLKGAGLSIRALDGVHILDCWNRRQLRASAGLLDLCDAKDRRTALLDKFDRRLGTLLHSVAANVIGVAVKD